MTKVKCKCRACGFKGMVRLIIANRTKITKKHKAILPRHFQRAKANSVKGVPATSVPCPKCGLHKLKRLRMVMA